MVIARETPFDLLIVDYDAAFARTLGLALQPLGFTPHLSRDLDDARALLQVTPCDFMMVSFNGRLTQDVQSLREMNDMLGAARLIGLVAEAPEAYEDVLSQAGVPVVLSRQLGMKSIVRFLAAQAEIRYLEEQNLRLRQVLDGRMGYENLIGGSPPMRSLYKLLDQIARTDAPVLISGEDGTERIDIARAVHLRSDRAGQPLILVDCADGVEDPAGVHIFGPLGSGNFATGPSPRNSAFARAGKGSLVLHRIEGLGATAQQRLLDFLHRPFFQNETPGQPQPLGRIIATAGANLLGKVENGEFLRELFYRLNILQVRVPPLRERREDIPLLAHHYLRAAQRQAAAGRSPMHSWSFSGRALLVLFQHEWPGNLEELRDVVREVAARAEGQQIEAEDLPAALRESGGGEGEGSGAAVKLNGSANMPLKDAKRLFESEYFKGLLKHVRGNMTMASRYSRVGRPYLYKKIREYGLEPETFR